MSIRKSSIIINTRIINMISLITSSTLLYHFTKVVVISGSWKRIAKTKWFVQYSQVFIIRERNVQKSKLGNLSQQKNPTPAKPYQKKRWLPGNIFWKYFDKSDQENGDFLWKYFAQDMILSSNLVFSWYNLIHLTKQKTWLARKKEFQAKWSQHNFHHSYHDYKMLKVLKCW